MAKQKSKKAHKPKPVAAPIPDDDFSFAGDVASTPQSPQVTLGEDFNPYDDLSDVEIEAILELARRRVEALNLYRPLPFQEEFHRSNAKERIVRGSNRAGKTLSTSVEVARAVTGQDPHDKYPKSDGRCVFVCTNGDAIGQVIFRKLFKPGAFKIIKDLETLTWRPFRPNDPSDKARRHETRLAPPLVPERLIHSIAWEKKVEGIPSMVKLHNGWEITFYSSLSSPPAGTDLDLVVFDEEIEVEEWYGEMAARLLDRSGFFIWGATPQVGTMQLYALHEKAVQEAKYHLVGQKWRTQEFFCTLADNPYIGEEEKQDFESKLSEEEKRYRIGGQFIVTTYRVYEEFNPEIHCVNPFDVPADWTHYMTVDPGRTVCAVLFAATAPPEHPVWGGKTVLYDELYISQCNAYNFGERVCPKVVGRFFQSFIIDMRGGRLTDIGGGKSVWQQYQTELEARNVRSAQTGSGFLKGDDNIEAGILAFKSWLEPHGGDPKVVVFTTLSYFQHEIKYYHNRKKKGQLFDAPEQRKNHLMDCARYLASHGCPYVQPVGFKKQGSPAWRAFQASLKREKQKSKRPGGIRVGPGSN